MSGNNTASDYLISNNTTYDSVTDEITNTMYMPGEAQYLLDNVLEIDYDDTAADIVFGISDHMHIAFDMGILVAIIFFFVMIWN